MRNKIQLIAEVVLVALGVAGIAAATSSAGRIHPERLLLGAAVAFIAAFLSSLVTGGRGWKRPRLRVCLLLSELCGAAIALFLNSVIITF